MERVVVTQEAEGLGEMLADLVRGNLAAHPDRAGLLDGITGKVNVTATDAGVTAGLLFTGGTLSIGTALPDADLTIEGDSATLMELTAVPLRFGNPDPTTAAGRAVIGKLATRGLRVRGMLTHPLLLMRVQRLLSVA